MVLGVNFWAHSGHIWCQSEAGGEVTEARAAGTVLTHSSDVTGDAENKLRGLKSFFPLYHPSQPVTP